ncbi:hypothetical protein [Sulfobacillus harzensis]|nr:hypothetical protein [Sulfobacillus harzensis]
MRSKSIWSMIRMVLGSILGIIGFGTLSMGFVGLNGAQMGLGVFEILLGVFLALGALSPMRKASHQH